MKIIFDILTEYQQIIDRKLYVFIVKYSKIKLFAIHIIKLYSL